MTGEQTEDGPMKITSERLGDVLRIAATGVLTLDGVELLAERTAAEHATHDGRAIVLDLRGVVILMNAASWRQTTHPAGRLPLRDVPLCYVVSPGYFRAALSRCVALANVGAIRWAVTALPDALEWAAQRREYWHSMPGSALVPEWHRSLAVL